MASPAVSQLQVVRDALWKRLAFLFESYRPERHYMRGPGPKWRAKYLPQ